MPPSLSPLQWTVVTYVGGWAAFSAAAWKIFHRNRATATVWGLAWPIAWPALLIEAAFRLDPYLSPSP
jgi:hypothetical protein